MSFQLNTLEKETIKNPARSFRLDFFDQNKSNLPYQSVQFADELNLRESTEKEF